MDSDMLHSKLLDDLKTLSDCSVIEETFWTLLETNFYFKCD